MPFLEEADLASMREIVGESLVGTAVLQTKSWVSDGGGGGTSIWSPAGTVSCRVAPLTSRLGEAVAGDRLNPDSRVVFTFPAETNIRHESQIVYGGGTFSVTAVRERSGEVSRRVEARGVE